MCYDSGLETFLPVKISFSIITLVACCVLQQLLTLLKSILEYDPNALIELGVDDDDRVDYFFCQTSAMKNTLQLYPEVLCVDSTYRCIFSNVGWLLCRVVFMANIRGCRLIMFTKNVSLIVGQQDWKL